MSKVFWYHCHIGNCKNEATAKVNFWMTDPDTKEQVEVAVPICPMHYVIFGPAQIGTRVGKAKLEGK